MATLFFITHPEVIVDPTVPVERWCLSPEGIGRMRRFAASPMLSNVEFIWSSGETKAIEAAGLLAGALGRGVHVCRELGENDRTSTGFLPPSEFEQVADAFFAQPETSVRGWERAVDAQRRVRQAIGKIVADHGEGDIAVIAHGAVGTLLFCTLTGNQISRSFDQPFQGHYWRAELSDLCPSEGWLPFAL